MTERALTIADVYQPLSTKDILGAQALSMQNALSQMQLSDVMKERGLEKGLQDYIKGKAAQGPVSMKDVQDYYQTKDPMKAMQIQQQQQERQQTQMKQELEAFKAAGDSGNSEAAKNIWNSGSFGKIYGQINSYSIKGEKRESTTVITQAGIDLLKQHQELTDIQREMVNSLKPGDRVKTVAADNGKKIETVELEKAKLDILINEKTGEQKVVELRAGDTIPKGWKTQTEHGIEVRIPAFMQGRDLPPDVMVDRKTRGTQKV